MTELESRHQRPGDVDRTGTPGAVHRSPGRYRVRSVLEHVVLIAVSLVMIYPLLWMVVSSLGRTTSSSALPASG